MNAAQLALDPAAAVRQDVERRRVERNEQRAREQARQRRLDLEAARDAEKSAYEDFDRKRGAATTAENRDGVYSAAAIAAHEEAAAAQALAISLTRRRRDLERGRA